MDREFHETWFETSEPCYRLDLRLGIPRSRAKGELERWIGDQGLCRHPDSHPSLILADILSGSIHDHEHIKQAVIQCSLSSGPIQVRLYQGAGYPQDIEPLSYRIKPNRGLCEFIRGLSDIFILGAPEGSLVSCMEGTVPDSPPSPPSGNKEWRASVHTGKESEEIPSAGVADDRLLQLSKGRYDFSPRKKSSGDPARRRTPRDEEQEKPLVFDILRIILRKGGIPLAEYDLYLRRWLAYPASISGKYERRTLREYRVRHGYQMTRPGWMEKSYIFAISDLHLGHQNAIPRYKRPFPMAKISEMDRVLIRNWNWTVKEEDIILYLGDLSFMSDLSPESYLKRLKGSIYYLEGNHDIYYSHMSHCLFMNYDDISFLFIHDPEELVRPFEGWVVHGHVHNKNLTDFPFFNPFEKRVNVSAEVIGYRPISLDEITRLVRDARDVIEFRDAHASCADEEKVSGVTGSRPVKGTPLSPQ